jgi:hypothetical protein
MAASCESPTGSSSPRAARRAHSGARLSVSFSPLEVAPSRTYDPCHSRISYPVLRCRHSATSLSTRDPGATVPSAARLLDRVRAGALGRGT